MTLSISRILITLSVVLLPCCTQKPSSPAERQTNTNPNLSQEPLSSPTTVLDGNTVFERALKTAVRNDKADYGSLRQSRNDLDDYIRFIANFDLAQLKTKHEQLAFYTNAFNAQVLALVRNRSEIISVAKEAGFFNELKVNIEGSATTLNDLEARALGDPRIHFIVNCASGSCPVLENRPFDAETLEQRLTAATLRFLQDETHGMKIDASSKTASLSNIFNWYDKDFAISGKPRNVLAWIEKQLGGAIQNQLTDGQFQVNWKECDWQLNSI